MVWSRRSAARYAAATMTSKTTTVDTYLADLPEDRRAALQAVRKTILANLDADYEESISYGMIGYVVPHRVYPAGYHCNPSLGVPFASIASQKNYMALYLCSIYGNANELAWFQEAWARTGKKLDMGKACIRFKKLDDLPLEVIGEAIRRVPARKFIADYEATLNESAKARTARRASATQAGGSSPAAKTAGVKRASATKKPVKKTAAAREVPKSGATNKSRAKKTATRKRDA